MHLKCLAATEVTCWLAFSTNRFFDHQRLAAAPPGNNGFAQCFPWWNTDPPPIFHGEHLVTLAVEPGIQGGIARSTDGDFGIQAIAQKEQTIRAGVALFLPWWWPSFCLKKVKLWLNNEQLRLIFLGKCRNSNMKRQGRNSNFPPQHFCVTDLPPSFAPASSISTSWSNANSKGDKNSPWSKR